MLDERLDKRIVISVGSIPALISLREQILQSEGYEVFSTTVPQEADLLISGRHCDVLLICYSLSDYWRKRLIENFRANCPQGRVVVITNHPVVQTSKEADALVYGVDGPEVLMDAVEGKAA
jgi:DNA-binding NtrC family response regulator